MELKKGYKQTEIGVIPEDWNLYSIDSLVSNIIDYRGVTPKKKGMDWGGGNIVALSAGNVKKGYIDYNAECYYGSLALYKKWMTNGDAKKGDIVFTLEAPLGNVALIPDNKKYILSQRTILLQLKNSFSSRFIFQQLISDKFQNYILSNSTGSTATGIKRKTFEKLYIISPKSFIEQQAVAEVLSDTDQLIQNLKNLIAKKKAIKQGAMQELLTGKKRLKGFTDKWETKKLGEIAFIQRGASPRPINDPIWFDEKSTVGWVRISDVTKSTKFLSKTVQKFSEQGINNSRFVSSDSLIMSICATIGRPIITEINVCIHDGFVVFRDLKLDKEFLYYYLTFIEDDWSKNGQTGSQMNLNTGLINQTKIKYPLNETEQQAIAQILNDMDAEIEALEQQLQKTQALKQGMMQELLTGKTRLVQPVTQEKTVPLAMVAEPEVVYKKETKPKKHNEHINDAVLIGTMADAFGSENYPLTRFMYTKVSYLLKRYKEEQDAGYLKKAAGPYKPKTRYGGAEKIALQNGYVKKHISNYNGKKYENFLAGDNVTEAINYFKDWYGENALQWIQQFKYTKRNKLELWATVDMAIEDLKQENKPINFETVKQLINNHKEWRPKLNRSTFSDPNIKEAISEVNQLFNIL